ncbi:hypothetical protein FRB99_001799 [Tulasnella sp. 403]|nr:hypothetical protein FRB99_001799 [Tulasnella sp. 403]
MHQFATSNVNPFSQRHGFALNIVNTLLATALFRCWHLILFFGLWATGVCLVSDKIGYKGMQTTLLTVFGSVLGFIISYRTNSSFERYNEGIRYWYHIVYASRLLAKAIWFGVPDKVPDKVNQAIYTPEKMLIEKKAAINLIEAFSLVHTSLNIDRLLMALLNRVAVKHYLRGEEGIFYEDLYNLVKFLPVYSLPPGRPSFQYRDSNAVLSDIDEATEEAEPITPAHSFKGQNSLPIPSPQSPPSAKHRRSSSVHFSPVAQAKPPRPSPLRIDTTLVADALEKGLISPGVTTAHTSKAGSLPINGNLFPAADPPKYALFDVFPFSLCVRQLLKHGKKVKGRRMARFKARSAKINHNIPLEIAFYLNAYIFSLIQREIVVGGLIKEFMYSLNHLLDCLTGLERILTTPIPFSYSSHLWAVTVIFVGLLPFQLWSVFRWFAIPSTAVASFVFFGFIVAGEEIENPFGYDKNDLNLDHFTHNVIRVELNSLTSRPMPNVMDWVFSDENTDLFGPPAAGGPSGHPMTPNEWARQGESSIREALSRLDANVWR